MFFTLHLISWSYANLRQMSKSKRLVEQILNWRLRFIRQAVAGTQEEQLLVDSQRISRGL